MKNVLVIEDNELDSSQIVKILQDDYTKVTLATTGKKAVKTDPHLVFDLKYPRLYAAGYIRMNN